MRAFFFCMSLWLASAASANSFDDALCRKATVPVAQMVSSEKLCRSFAIGVGAVPSATSKEVQAMLTPEALTAMAGLTAIWLGTQAIPIVGEAVDAALVALGVILLATQAADLSHALWSYVNLAVASRSHQELEAAAEHLARAVALVGVNVVTFILTKKLAGKPHKQPGPEHSPLQAARPRGAPPAEFSAPALRPASPSNAAMATNQAKPPIALHEATPAGGAARPSHGPLSPGKRSNLEAFKTWLDGATKRAVKGDEPAIRFQRAVAGEHEVLVKGGGKQIWADGVRSNEPLLVEAKFVDKPDKSPFIDGSKCDELVRTIIQNDTRAEFERYAAVLRDPETPMIGLEVVTNDARAIPFFESLMRELGIPGRVVSVAWEKLR